MMMFMLVLKAHYQPVKLCRLFLWLLLNIHWLRLFVINTKLFMPVKLFL